MSAVVRLAALVLLTALLAAVPAGAATPAASCPGVTATGDTFATVGAGNAFWLENMGFDGRGGMWVSELLANQLVRFDAQGRPGTALSVPNPGASLPGPDGRMYVMYGDAVAAPGTTNAGVDRFDPFAATPTIEPFAGGLPMANGAAFDAAGNLYVADTVTTNAGLDKFRPDGSRDAAFTTTVPVSGADGIAIDGDTLYTTLFSDAASSIVRVPLSAPAKYDDLTQLSPGGSAPKAPDDATIGPDGRLWVATNVGQLVRVDLATGDSCVVWSTTAPIDSVRFARGFPPYDDAEDAFLTSQDGTLFHVHVTTPAGAALPPAPAVLAPAMRLTVSPRHVRRGRTRTLQVVVRSAATSCRAGVRVRVGARSALTDARGRARITAFRSTRRGLRVLRATKSGCLAAIARVRVRR